MKNIIRLTIFVTLLVLAWVVIHKTGANTFLEKDLLRSWISGYGNQAPAAFILLFAVAPSLFLPGLPITLAGGLVFGPIWGTVYASIGSTIGACIAFLISRYGARRYVASLVSGRLQTLDAGLASQGWVFVAITRLIPLFPFNLLNYAFGLTKIRFRTYALASWVFMLPGTAAYTIAGSSLLDILKGELSSEVLAAVLFLAAVSLFPLFYRVYQKKRVARGANL